MPRRTTTSPTLPRPPLWREFVSRGALLVLGLALLYGAYRCFRLAGRFHADDVQRRERASPGDRHRRSDTSSLPFIAGVVLVIPGGILAVASLLPVSVMEKVFGGPPRNTTLWENDAPDGRNASWWDWW